ncbi:g4902 [Coccomyxa elongata]
MEARREQHLQVKEDELIGATLEKGDGLKLWYCTLSKSKSGQDIRHLRTSAHFTCTSAQAAQKTVNYLRNLGSPCKCSFGKRLLVIINPHSGRGKAKKAYHSFVESIFDAAGFEVVLHVTQHAGHATDIVRNAPLEQFQAVVAVGGDGTAFEVLQGYFQVPDWQQRIKTPFCLVPSGSGNALSANCGLWSAVTAAHAVCKGKQRPIDIFSVLQPQGQCFYAFLSIYYGMMANLDRGTDHLRWMGSVRFTIGALLEVLQRKKYAARVAYVRTVDAGIQSPSGHAGDSQGAGQEKGSGMNGSQKGEYRSLEGSTASHGPATILLDDLGNLSQLDLCNANSLPQGWQMLPHDETSFFAAVNLPLLDFNSRTGPQAGFDTGCLDLMYVADLKSRKEGLEFLDAAGKGKHLELTKCLLEKVVALIIEPLSPGTWLVVDGEDIDYRRVFVEVHPKLCSVIVA